MCVCPFSPFKAGAKIGLRAAIYSTLVLFVSDRLYEMAQLSDSSAWTVMVLPWYFLTAIPVSQKYHGDDKKRSAIAQSIHKSRHLIQFLPHNFRVWSVPTSDALALWDIQWANIFSNWCGKLANHPISNARSPCAHARTLIRIVRMHPVGRCCLVPLDPTFLTIIV